MNKMWRSVTNELAVDPDRTDAGFRLRTHYLKYLYPYERRFFLGLNDEDFDFAAFERMLTKAATKETKGGRASKIARIDQDDMNSESYSDSNPQDHMNHYAFPNTESQTFDFNPNIRQSPTPMHDQFHSFHPTTTTNHHGTRGARNGARTADTHAANGNHASENARIGTRSRTGARVAHSSPDEKESREVEKETVPKGRTKRARTERREALLIDSESTQMSLASNFAKLDLGALKKYKQYHQMRLDTSANKSEIIEAVSIHFSQQQVDEVAIIRKFVAHVKSESDTRREREARRRHSKIVRV
eukprot:Phypoly_transcript_07726.p1 GENE.Phypoly_transcript_07726~~Phypoly_transcript_07726.p1  ORF type:complete len:302 (+),score=44.48 Phypoly_transcript_07726:594-1499(+)